LLTACYRRTASLVQHKQNPATAAQAKPGLDGLKKKRRPAA
jgi:hypothetical protein